MEIITIVLIALALSMDAFSVAVGKGLNMKKVDVKWALVIATFFGVFQAIMPAIGWILGGQFDKYISSCDHWIAFGLLAFMGGKMIYESRTQECEITEDKRSYKELLVLAIATSIDALAAGISFALDKIDIVLSAILIGIITFALSFLGVFIGNKFGCKYKNKAELFGGVILIAIGIKILIEHLF
jgi:putative Mn2+ efflux pump MntP